MPMPKPIPIPRPDPTPDEGADADADAAAVARGRDKIAVAAGELLTVPLGGTDNSSRATAHGACRQRLVNCGLGRHRSPLSRGGSPTGAQLRPSGGVAHPGELRAAGANVTVARSGRVGSDPEGIERTARELEAESHGLAGEVVLNLALRSGVSDAGLRMIAQPAVNAGATFQVAIWNG